MFPTPSKPDIIIAPTFNLLSANALNLVQSKKLSFGKVLNADTPYKLLVLKNTPSKFCHFILGLFEGKLDLKENDIKNKKVYTLTILIMLLNIV